jgi:hypothetical protein
VEDLDLTHVPPGRPRTLARYAALSKAQAIQRMPDERQIATLLAFARVYESVAQDDVVTSCINLLARSYFAPSILANMNDCAPFAI